MHAEGSVLVEAGKTKVICTASVEDRVPAVPAQHRQGLGHRRIRHAPARHDDAHAARGDRRRVGGRTQEIQRLIGRSLRAVTKMEELGERTITLDCDVIQADGGTRTASITGAFVALVLAIQNCATQDCCARCPCTITSPPPASASSTASRCSTSPTSRTRARKST
jgi:ribonuclease PH